ncbi:PREDICTED: CDP-diacylglycerol--glycerol-3-phosphate 3-phosphatidyltransferase, mitochondrial-like, partial [Priapulus caudatus]|uniref:CDP-diacylglycerol--glycerol-3-phosphate 3-phosphatidyltransferase n=1 Tax=Priapulus caudatus TaxID=37621 RepID=A0ABM1F4F8_PRICU
VDCVYEALEQSSRGPEPLQVRMLLDYTRGSREDHGGKSSRTMLLPLLRDFADSVQVALYHTPDLRGMYKFLLRGKFSETVGLQHMKIYLFDDAVVMSG